MTRLLLLPALACLVLLTACGETATPAELHREFVATMDDLIETLNGVESQEDYDAAQPELQRIKGRLKSIEKRAASDLSDQEYRELEAKMKKGAPKLGIRLVPAMARAAKYEGLGDFTGLFGF